MIVSYFERFFISNYRIYAAIAAYFLVIVALRVLLFPGMAEDDAEQLYYAQSWSLGYKGNQPPLFTWLVRFAEGVFGVGVGALFAVKYSILFGFYALSFLTAKAIIHDRTLAAFAALSPVTLYYVGWDSIVNYSNSLALVASQAAALFMMMRLRKRADFGSFILFGLTIGCGFLAKYNFVLSLVPMLVAGALHPDIRSRLFSHRIFITIGIACFMMIPHGYWAVTDQEGIATVLNSTARPWQISETWFIAAASGLGGLISGMLAFLLPGGLIIVAIFHRALILARQETSATIRFFETYFICYALILVSIVLVTQATEIQNHWLMGLLPLSFYVFALLDQRSEAVSKRSRQVYASSILVISILVLLVLTGRSIVAPETCRKCNFFIPWSEVAEHLRGAGFDNGTIVAFDYPNQISGNLRRHFPDSRVMSARFSPMAPPSKHRNGGCLVIWNPVIEPDGFARSGAIRYTNRLLSASIDNDVDDEIVTVAIHRSQTKTISFRYILKQDGAGNCR